MKEEYGFSNGKRGVLRGHLEKEFSNAKKTKSLAVCIESDNLKLLSPRKSYNATFWGDELVSVIDETGEEAIYSAKLFLRISLPSEIESVLENITA